MYVILTVEVSIDSHRQRPREETHQHDIVLRGLPVQLRLQRIPLTIGARSPDSAWRLWNLGAGRKASGETLACREQDRRPAWLSGVAEREYFSVRQRLECDRPLRTKDGAVHQRRVVASNLALAGHRGAMRGGRGRATL